MLRARQLAISLVILSTSLLVAAEDGAKTEKPKAAKPGWAEMFRDAEWVSRLHIEGVGQLVNPSLSRNHLVAIQGYRYSASIVQSWKGDHSGTIRFQVALNDCPRVLQVDSEYIVFGSSDLRGTLESDSCDKIIALEEADPLLPQLEKLLAGG